MKNKVKYSTYSLVATAVVVLLTIVGTISLLDDTDRLIRFLLIMGTATLAGLYYCPKSVEADGNGVAIRRILGGTKRFAYDSILSADTCYPSAGGLRLCGSGGYFGYWGYFNDIMIGTDFGYYGSRSHCFLLKLRDGKQYVVGCEDASAMVSHINKYL
ncbi:MAG: PH domain-containing protein [Staphylococcus sp.]|nr:PH domain-containing protein [Staphylococcus sp.]